jgi:hypothetical protein
MNVNTKKVSGRRELRFDSFDDLLAEAERLCAGEVKMLGNWTLAQMLEHIASGLNSTIDGSSFKAPLILRLVLAPLMKKKFLNKGLAPGFPSPKDAEAQFLPKDDAEIDAGLKALRAAIDRLISTDELANHPLFGKLTRDESDNFQLRHAEMHLSFAIPVD